MLFIYLRRPLIINCVARSNHYCLNGIIDVWSTLIYMGFIVLHRKIYFNFLGPGSHPHLMKNNVMLKPSLPECLNQIYYLWYILYSQICYMAYGICKCVVLPLSLLELPDSATITAAINLRDWFSGSSLIDFVRGAYNELWYLLSKDRRQNVAPQIKRI